MFKQDSIYLYRILQKPQIFYKYLLQKVGEIPQKWLTFKLGVKRLMGNGRWWVGVERGRNSLHQGLRKRGEGLRWKYLFIQQIIIDTSHFLSTGNTTVNETRKKKIHVCETYILIGLRCLSVKGPECHTKEVHLIEDQNPLGFH